MSLLGPDEKDIMKIHSEINQIVQQRYLLTTLAVTIFGVMSAWMFTKQNLRPGDETIIFFIGILQLIVLLALFFVSMQLLNMLRILSSYLIETNSSNWEKDWQNYRKENKDYSGYTKSQIVIFQILGALSAFIPFIVAMTYDLKIINWYFILLLGLLYGYFKCLKYKFESLPYFQTEESIRKNWEKLR